MTQQPPPSINLHGAVDLSALAAPPPPPPSADTPDGLVLDVTEETFNDVIQQSNQVPVLVLLWQVGEGQSIQLNTTMQTLVTEQAGKFVLARVDVAAHPRLAQVFQVQAVPAAVAVIKGQPVPLFQGAPAAEQVRPVLDQLLQLAQEQGVTGTVDTGQEPGTEEETEPPLPPHIQAAYDAIEADDLDGAAAAFEQAVTENPADVEAAAGLAQVQLLQRISGLDPAQVLQRATEAPASDLDAQLPAADLEVAGGRLAEGYARLLQVIRVTAGEDKERARVRLLELFRLAADDAPEVVKARRDLAIALY